MKSFIVAMIALFAIMVSGCSIFQGPSGEILNEVVVKNVSVKDGITVGVNGVECTFEFTTDRQVILDDVQDCLYEHANSYVVMKLTGGAVPLVSATPMTLFDAERPPLDPAVVQLAENATDDILKQSEVLNE